MRPFRTAVFGMDACCLPRCVEIHGHANPAASFRTRMLTAKGPPFPVGCRPETPIRQISQKNHQLRVHKVDNWFCGPKTFVFGSQNPSMRDGLNGLAKNIFPTPIEISFCRSIESKKIRENKIQSRNTFAEKRAFQRCLQFRLDTNHYPEKCVPRG